MLFAVGACARAQCASPSPPELPSRISRVYNDLTRAKRALQLVAVAGFGVEVSLVVVVRRKGVGHPFHDVDAEPHEARDFFGIVCQETNAGKAKMAEHLGCGLENAFVILESQSPVRLHGVIALILQRVGAQFVDQTNAAAFLGEIKQHACACLMHETDRAAQLVATIAAQTGQEITGKALRMEAHQHGRVGVGGANNHRDMLDPGIGGPERNDPCRFGVGERDLSAGNWGKCARGLNLKASDGISVGNEQVVSRGPSRRLFTIWHRGEDDGREQAGPFAQCQRTGCRAGFALGELEGAAHGVVEVARRISQAADRCAVDVGRQRDHHSVLARGRDIENCRPQAGDGQEIRLEAEVGERPKAVLHKFGGENDKAVPVFFDDNGGSPPQFGNGADDAPSGSRDSDGFWLKGK